VKHDVLAINGLSFGPTNSERPRLHKVILVNDDLAPRELIVMVLKAVFCVSEDQALRVMIIAHRPGAVSSLSTLV
jgi:ATP-dependent Clp protease adapter protein ClpS